MPLAVDRRADRSTNRGTDRNADRSAMGGPLESLASEGDGSLDPRFERLGLSLARMSALERGLDEVIVAIPQFQNEHGSKWVEAFADYYLGKAHRDDLKAKHSWLVALVRARPRAARAVRASIQQRRIDADFPHVRAVSASEQ